MGGTGSIYAVALPFLYLYAETLLLLYLLAVTQPYNYSYQYATDDPASTQNDLQTRNFQ